MADVSDQKKLAALEAFATGCTVDEAAQRAGVSSRTLYRWAEIDPDFSEAVQDAKCKADDAVEAVTFRNCIDPDPSHNTLRIFWLKNRRPEVYNRPTVQRHQFEPFEIDLGATPEDQAHDPDPAPEEVLGE